jgi:PmbA protein
MTVARRLADLEEPAAVGRRAALRALRRLGARPVATCEVPVIFDPVTAPSLLSHLSACVNGYAVYCETSYLAGQLGKIVASDLVSVVDDGRRPGGLGSKPFDAEGLPTRRNVVIDRGRLASYLLDSYSARKVGGRSTGNAARSPGSPPTVAPTNLWLEPGEASLDEIVATTDRGLLVTELIGMGFNPVDRVSRRRNHHRRAPRGHARRHRRRGFRSRVARPHRRALVAHRAHDDRGRVTAWRRRRR